MILQKKSPYEKRTLVPTKKTVPLQKIKIPCCQIFRG
jgi:hypothetical protein